jgi:uncharacterized caspase-like protein
MTAISLILAIAASGPWSIAQEDARGVEAISADEESTEVDFANRHALIIGIDEYEDPGYPDLSYAVADARAVAKTPVVRFGFPEDNVRLILNQDATQGAIAEALEDWASNPERIGDDDFLVVVFFAGHGVTRDVKNRGLVQPCASGHHEASKLGLESTNSR